MNSVSLERWILDVTVSVSQIWKTGDPMNRFPNFARDSTCSTRIILPDKIRNLA
jgi:hypothetical protein